MATTPGLSNANTTISPLQPWWNNGSFNDPPQSPTSLIDERFQKINSTDYFQYPGDLPKYYFQLIVSQYQRDLISGDDGPISSRIQMNPEKIIRLPLPIGLIDNHIVDYEEQPLNQVLSGAISLTDINIARSKLGYSPNSILTIFLKGPKYKRYQLSWRVSPKNPAEARSLQQIVLLLNNSMSPDITVASLFGLGLLSWFKFPKVFFPEIHPNSQYMYKFKPAVLENFVVNYTPGGQAAFYRESNQTKLTGGTSGDGNGNAPEGLEIQMQFLELEYWLAGDFKDNNNPRDTSARSAPFVGEPPSDFGE